MATTERTAARGYIGAPWGQIHYEDTGMPTAEAGPPVLLYPQRPRSASVYRRLAGLLAEHYRVVTIDPPGFGRSDPLPEPFEVKALTDAVLTLMDGLGVERFHLSGHHTGATICVDAAVTAPERVVAIAPSGLLLLTDDERESRLDGSQFAPAAGNPPMDDGSHLDSFVERFPVQAPEDAKFVTEWMIDTLESDPYQRAAAFAVYRYDERAMLPLVKVPTLFLQSTGPGEPPTLQRMADAQALVRGSRLELIEGGDIHFVHHRADEVGGLLRDFFGEVAK